LFPCDKLEQFCHLAVEGPHLVHAAYSLNLPLNGRLEVRFFCLLKLGSRAFVHSRICSLSFSGERQIPIVPVAPS
jgi:hypothetical protein